MGIGVSLLLMALGAILVWAVTASVAGVSLVTVGWILLAVGFVGLLVSLIIFGSTTHIPRRRRSYYDDEL
jgi:divalent metal cation (Fe/Co/Zn/Cd) transporter